MYPSADHLEALPRSVLSKPHPKAGSIRQTLVYAKCRRSDYAQPVCLYGEMSMSELWESFADRMKDVAEAKRLY